MTTKREERSIYYMLGKIEATLESIEELLKNANDDHEDLEKRVRKVENKQWYAAGVATLVGTFVGYFFPK